MKTSTSSPSTPAPAGGWKNLAIRLRHTLRVRLGRCGLLALCALAWPVTPAQAVVNQFELTGPLDDERRFGHSATLLPDGRVWVVGGFINFQQGLAQSGGTEFYDPATGIWSRGPSLPTGRYGHTATLLSDGKVLINGGVGDSSRPGTMSSNYNHHSYVVDVNDFIFDGANNYTDLNYGANSTATLIGGLYSRVVIVGGEFEAPSSAPFDLAWSGLMYTHVSPFSSGYSLASTELYASYGILPLRTLHAAAALPGSRALIVGGLQTVPLATAEICDYIGEWTFTGSLITARHSHTATALKDGKVLVTGGVGTAGSLASAELYDPATGVWTATAPLAAARSSHTATLLWDGRVLVTGGANAAGDAIRSAAIYDPATGAWTGVGSLVTARKRHTATLLPNRKVLIVGGIDIYGNTAELFDAPYRDIAVEQPVGAVIANGGGATFFAAASGSPLSTTFTIRNPGTLNLGGLGITKSGPGAAAFTVTANPTSPVVVGASTTFTIRFAPTTTGTSTATIQIANNTVANNPYVINLTGTGVSFSVDTDGDGLSDGQEAEMAALGFDWQVAQPTLVATYFAAANGSGLYTTAQVQALNVGAPLLTKNAVTGKFTLTMEVKKSTNLANVPFAAFPMNGAGMTTVINAQGKVEFVFPSTDNAAFFRVQAQ